MAMGVARGIRTRLVIDAGSMPSLGAVTPSASTSHATGATGRYSRAKRVEGRCVASGVIDQPAAAPLAGQAYALFPTGVRPSWIACSRS
jgi:hypothetical protein